MKLNLSTPTATALFPVGTPDTSWAFAISGTLADGTAYSTTTESDTPSETLDLDAGVYTVVVTKNGVSSLPSDSFTVTAVTTVTLSVPDASQKAAIAAA